MVSMALVGVLAYQLIALLYSHRFDVTSFLSEEMAILDLRKPFVFDLGWQTIALLAAVVWYLAKREKQVYLLDFATFEAPDSWRISVSQFMDILKKQECFSPESIDFMDRMVKQSGTGPAVSSSPRPCACLALLIPSLPRRPPGPLASCSACPARRRCAPWRTAARRRRSVTAHPLTFPNIAPVSPDIPNIPH